MNSSVYALAKVTFGNLDFILPQLVLYGVIIFVGINVWLRLFKFSSIFFVFFSGSLLGLFLYMFYLSLISYLFKGPDGILLITIAFFSTGLILSVKNVQIARKIKYKFSYSEVIGFFIFTLFSALMFFQIGANIYGGDVIAYWGFATSFSNGNYPLMSPWQPNILANHHQTTYLVEGAFHALSRADMKQVHSLYSYFVLITGVGLLWRYAVNQKLDSIISIIYSIIIFVGLGGIYILIPEFLNELLEPEVTHPISTFPTFLSGKNRLGGASNIPDLIYINHRLAAMSGVFLLAIMMLSKNINEKYKFLFPTLIAILSVVILSSDEGFLPAIGLMAIYWFFIELKYSKSKSKILKKFIFSGVIFLIAFFTVGGAIRDSMLTEAHEESRFGVVHNLEEFSRRLSELKGVIFVPDYIENLIWYMPHILIIFIAAIYYQRKYKTDFGKLMLVATIGSLIGNMLIEHTYYASNNGRFLHMIYFFLTASLIYNVICSIKVSKSNFKYASAIILFLYSLTTIFSFMYILEKANKDSYPNLNGELPSYEILSWSKYNLANERIMFVDGFLKEYAFSHLSLFGTQNYGLMVPVGPANYKVHTPDFGPEAIDVVNTINPSAVQSLDVEYVYIEDKYIDTFSTERQIELQNNDYFELIHTDTFGKLYKIKSEFISQGYFQKNSLEYLKQLISQDSVVYIDWPPQMQHDLRSSLTLIFKDNKRVVTERRHGTFNLIETRIKTYEPAENDKYDYLLLAPETDPLSVCNCEVYELIWETYGAKGYKITDND